MNNLVPSPFTGAPQDFLDEVAVLCEKFGYENWLVMVSEPIDNHNSRWEGGANAISDGMISAMEEATDWMQQTLDEHR